MSERARIVNLGSDQVEIRPDRLIVTTQVRMDLWEVRRYRRTLITFQDRTWAVTRESPGSRGLTCYELEPWAPSLSDLPGPELRYDLDFIRARDASHRAAWVNDVASPYITLTSPVLGLLWTDSKRSLQTRVGLDPVTITRRSIFLEYLFAMLCMSFATISVWVGALGVARIFFVSSLLVVLDALMRYDSLLREECYPPGFYEWLWRWVARR